MEPFHPKRYGGLFHRMATDMQSVEQALNLIWYRWSGLNHVWEASGWPFAQNPTLNEGVVLCAGRVVFLQRRNLLRRVDSSIVSSQLRFWVGTRDEFRRRADNVQLQGLKPSAIRDALKRDHTALWNRCRLLDNCGIPVMHLFYEDIYGEGRSPSEQLHVLDRLLDFLGFAAISKATFEREWSRLLGPETYRWTSPEFYREIPCIQDIEHEVGSDETGWLFK